MSFFGADLRKSYRRLLVFAISAILTASLILNWSQIPSKSAQPLSKPREQAFVVASLQADDTSWIHEHLPDWYLFRYIVDDKHAEYTVPENKGREAMVYLTYVCDLLVQTYIFDQLSPDLLSINTTNCRILPYLCIAKDTNGTMTTQYTVGITSALKTCLLRSS